MKYQLLLRLYIDSVQFFQIKEILNILKTKLNPTIMLKIISLAALNLLLINSITAQRLAISPKYFLYSDLASHLKGNQAATFGIDKFLKNDRTLGFEFSYIYDYRFKNLAANRIHNQTNLSQGSKNFQTAVNYSFPISFTKNTNQYSRFFSGVKLAYSNIHYTHNQSVPTNSGKPVPAFAILSNNEMMDNTFSTHNHRVDGLITIGYQHLTDASLSYEIFAGFGLSFQANKTIGTSYTLVQGATTHTLKYSQGFEPRYEKYLAFNNSGAKGFSALPVFQLGAKIGWTTFKKGK